MNTYSNTMNQYHPCHRACEDRQINCRNTPEEYQDVVRPARAARLRRIDGAGE